MSPISCVTLFDPDARPICKDKLKSPTEFGYKVVLPETEERVVTGYEVLRENSLDHTLLPEAVRWHKAVWRHIPREVAADRGFSTADTERLLVPATAPMAARGRRHH